LNSQVSQRWQNATDLARHLLTTHNGHLTVAMPLGLGKANHLINAIYQQVSQDSSMSLTILSALSLQTPNVRAGLEANFFMPVAERLYADYTELLYARDLVANTLPSNVEVSEFFIQAGVYLNNVHAQSNYISANYTHVSGYLLEKNVDVVIQMVAHSPQNDTPYGSDLSLSCNPDITLELLAARNEGKANFALIAELNDQLPFMPNDAQLPEASFAHILEGESARSSLFNVPKAAVDIGTYAAGFHASSLVKDGGTLQIGIGSAGDAVAYALIMRQQDNSRYKKIISALNKGQDISELTHLHLEPFEIGLYGVSEMLVDVFLDLIQAGVVKREVNGILIQGGFFLGPNSMYQRMRDMTHEQRAKINMTSIGYINGAHIGFNEKQKNRQHARFINNGMKATLLGAVVSDGLDDGKVVSGVGGQYDFVRQSFALDNARSIIMINATRNAKGRTTSNVVWSYGHTTIPRHLRDIVINEYGIADLRGMPDKHVIAQMLSITGCEFQAELLNSAKNNGKIGPDFKLKADWKDNSQAALQQALQPFRDDGSLPDYPFGTDFTDLEQRLIVVLQALKTASQTKIGLAKLVFNGITRKPSSSDAQVFERLGLMAPSSIKDRITRWALLGVLHNQ